MQMDEQFGHWLAGFTDGEGCFLIDKGMGTHSPRFVLSTRIDDLPILTEIRDRLQMGNIYSKKSMPDGYRRSAAVALHIVRKEHIIQLAALFDRYPLRAKKQNDFRIWRIAVALWASHDRYGVSHSIQAELAVLKAELEAQRRPLKNGPQ